MEEKTILVTGIGGNVGQGVLRNIRSTKPEIKIVGTDISSFTPGNHLCDITYLLPYAYTENYIAEIKKIIIAERVDLIIPTTDYEVYYLSLNKTEIGTKVAASESSIALKYLDKYLTYLHHLENDIPFAKSWLPSTYDGSCNSVILKPREGRGSRGVQINPPSIKDFNDTYMVQPLHIGVEITTAFYVKRDGTLHGLFTMERELNNGATSKSKTTKKYDIELEKIISKMIECGGLYGSINLQSIVDENNCVIPFEVNCRISGTNSIRHNLGFQDVKYTIEEYVFGLNPSPIKAIEGIAIRMLTDIIYPFATNEIELNNKQSKHILY